MGSLPSGETSVTCALPCQGIAEHSGASSDDVPRRGIYLHCRTRRETRHVIENCGFGSSGWICPCIHISICSYAFLVAHGPAEVHFVSPGNHETFHVGAARTSSVNLPLLAAITSGWSCVGSSALRCPLHFHLQDGYPDVSYFSPDCFHPSQKGHSQLAKALWNALVRCGLYLEVTTIKMISVINIAMKAWITLDFVFCFFFTSQIPSNFWH